MAINPTTTGQPTGWGLGALGAPSVSTAPLAQKPQFTPEQIAQMRKEAMALQQPPTEPIRHWTQGLAELVRAMQGNREADFAREQEMSGRQRGAEAVGQIYAPYLSPGGNSPASAPVAAPARASEGGPAGVAPPTITAGNSDDPRGMIPYIRETAAKYGVDPDVAVKVAQSEGLRTFSGDGGKSGGAFQLYTGGGMGNDFQKETGLDPLDPKNERATIEYALKNVPKVGWTPFHGARKVGIGARDGIMAQDATAPTTAEATPTGLSAPIPTPVARPIAAPPPVPPNQAAGAPPTRLAYAGDTIPPGMVPGAAARGAALPPTANVGAPAPIPGMDTMVRTIAGRPLPPLPTAATPATPLAPLPGAVPDFAKQAAIPAVPLAPGQANLPGFPPVPAAAAPPVAPPVPDAAAPAGPVPLPMPRPPVPMPTGSAVPGAEGPTSVGGAPLVSPQDRALLSAISGRPDGGPAAPAGASGPMAPIRVAQNGLPTAAVPAASVAPPAGAAPGSPGLPSPLTSPVGQVTQDQLTRVLANPWVPEQAKAAMLQMIQQRGQPQSMPVEGGTMMFNAAGQKVFIPEPKFGQVKIGSAEIPTVSHFDPATGRWNTTTLAPGGGVQTTPGGGGQPTAHPAQAQGGAAEPDLSSISGIQAEEARQAGAKKASEAGGEAQAKYYNAVHTGLAGSAMVSAQQKQNIDAIRQIVSSPDFIAGTFNESGLAMQRLAASLGINPKAAAGRELFDQLSAKILSDQMSGLKSMSSEAGEVGGRIFKPFLDLEEKASIKPSDTVPGILAKINYLDKQGDLFMKYADVADDYIQKHGVLDAGFDKYLRKEIAGSRIENVVPGQEGNKAPAAAPPPAAADYLKAHPELRDQFEAKYGKGSADSVLGK